MLKSSRIAKEFTNEKGKLQIYVGTVTSYTDEDGTGLYSVKYDDGDVEDFDCDDYADAHEEKGLALTTIPDTEPSQDKKIKATLCPALEELTDLIRELGSLGETWTHQWSDGNSKSLKKIALPLDQSKHIFRVDQLEGLQRVVYIAVPPSKLELRTRWVGFLREYAHAIEIMTKIVDYEPGDIDILEGYVDRAYTKLLEIAGIEGLTNYFHYFGSGHIIWMTRIHGNLWRHRNEGVAGMNGVLSLRYNKFNNRGGNKGRSKDGNNEKCEAFEVLGSWMSRLIMWHTQAHFHPLGGLIVQLSYPECRIEFGGPFATILFCHPKQPSGPQQRLHHLSPTRDLDRWVSEEGIFMHAADYEMDEIY